MVHVACSRRTDDHERDRPVDRFAFPKAAADREHAGDRLRLERHLGRHARATGEPRCVDTRGVDGKAAGNVAPDCRCGGHRGFPTRVVTRFVGADHDVAVALGGSAETLNRLCANARRVKGQDQGPFEFRVVGRRQIQGVAVLRLGLTGHGGNKVTGFDARGQASRNEEKKDSGVQFHQKHLRTGPQGTAFAVRT